MHPLDRIPNSNDTEPQRTTRANTQSHNYKAPWIYRKHMVHRANSQLLSFIKNHYWAHYNPHWIDTLTGSIQQKTFHWMSLQLFFYIKNLTGFITVHTGSKRTHISLYINLIVFLHEIVSHLPVTFTCVGIHILPQSFLIESPEQLAFSSLISHEKPAVLSVSSAGTYFACYHIQIHTYIYTYKQGGTIA